MKGKNHIVFLCVTLSYQSGFHLVHLGYTLGADTESHGSQTWQRNAMTLSGPSLNHLASRIQIGRAHV